MFSCNKVHARCWFRLTHVYFLAYFSSANELLLPLSFLYGLHVQKFCPGKRIEMKSVVSSSLYNLHTTLNLVQFWYHKYTYEDLSGSSAKISDSYSRGARFKSRLGHRLFWATFEVLFLISLKKIPGSFRVVRLGSLPSLSFPVCYVYLPAFKVVGTFWENDVKTASNKYSSAN
jgi:hypothetical protein